MMDCTEVKQGVLVKTGKTLGIIVQDEMKYEHYNHYARVYYFTSLYHDVNPTWVFLGSLRKVEK